MSAPPHDTDSLVGLIYGVHIAMITLAAVTVVARVLAGLGAEDITIVLALILAITTVALNLEQTKYGLGQHIYNLPPTTNFQLSEELFYFGQIVYMMAVGVTKLAILFLYLRIIPSPTYRYAIYALMAFVSLTVITCVMADIFQCTPISHMWNPLQDGYCINQIALFYSNAALNIFQDLVIYVFPMHMLYQLQLPKKQRIALIAIFGVGGFVCMTSMIRLSSLKAAVGTKDPTYDNVGAANWSVVEVCIGIVCASLVHFKPLIDRFAPRWMDFAGDDSLHKHSHRSEAYLTLNSHAGAPQRPEYIRQETRVEVEMEPQTKSVRPLRADP